MGPSAYALPVGRYYMYSWDDREQPNVKTIQEALDRCPGAKLSVYWFGIQQIYVLVVGPTPVSQEQAMTVYDWWESAKYPDIDQQDFTFTS